MLDLIYSGEREEAWKIFNESWPDYINGKKEFLSEFQERLSTSQYWSEINQLN
jgi:hypothetical protein